MSGKKLHYSHILTAIFFICILGTAASFILQHGFGYNPCPLCIFQRVAMIITGIVAFILALFSHRTSSAKIISAVLVLLPTAFGISSAAKQIYLQSLPADQVPTCGPGLAYLIQNNSFFAMFEKVFSGSGECAIVEKFLYIPLPVWSLLAFVVIALLAIGGIFTTPHNNKPIHTVK